MKKMNFKGLDYTLQQMGLIIKVNLKTVNLKGKELFSILEQNQQFQVNLKIIVQQVNVRFNMLMDRYMMDRY